MGASHPLARRAARVIEVAGAVQLTDLVKM
jgi:hypothetical protein